jgi:26S proteasome regulatory subunit N2
MAALTSVGGFLALLDESEPDELKLYALQQLNSLVDQFWAEIAESITKMHVTVLSRGNWMRFPFQT